MAVSNWRLNNGFNVLRFLPQEIAVRQNISGKMKILKTIVGILIVLSTFITSLSYAQAPVRELKDYSTEELVKHFATQYQVSPDLMTKIIRCESQFNPSAVGDHNKSFGLVQIHLPSHPEVTKEQAFSPVYAVEFLAKELSKQNGKIWTCYRLMTKSHR